MFFRIAPVLILVCLVPYAVSAQTITARQVVLQPKDVPHNPPVKAQTHAVAGYGACDSAYQSEFGSGLTIGGGDAPLSVAYQCPSAASAAQLFSTFASYYEQYYNRPSWHYQRLSALKAGAHHAAWSNQGLPGVTSGSGKRVKAGTITLAFQRENFLVFLQVTYMGETLQAAERTTSRLGHIMNRHIVSGR